VGTFTAEEAFAGNRTTMDNEVRLDLLLNYRLFDSNMFNKKNNFKAYISVQSHRYS
jgi:hypothetical protein